MNLIVTVTVSSYLAVLMSPIVVTTQELSDWHRPRIAALVAAGADLLAVETIPCQGEAEAVLTLLQNEFPDARAYVTFTCKVRYLLHTSIFLNCYYYNISKNNLSNNS